MKVLILALLLVASPVMAQQFRVVREYDRFEDRTRYFTEPILLKFGLDVSASFSFRGKGEGHEIEGFWLVFSSRSPDQKFAKSSRLHFLVDGQSLDFGTPATSNSNANSRSDLLRVEEVLIFRTNYQLLKKIAKGKTVEMRLGQTEIFLHKYQRDAIQELLSKVRVVKKK